MSTLPSEDIMYRAIVDRDATFDGAFYVAVRTTGIFCRPGCGAKKPKRTNVEFFASHKDCLHAGYRPCKRCRPLDGGTRPPEWITKAHSLIEQVRDRRLGAADLRAIGLDPARVSRYFKAQYGMTFQAYHRARRLGGALGQLREGGGVGRAAAKSGFASESGFRAAFERAFGAPAGKISAENAVVLRAVWLSTPLGPMLAVAGESGVRLLEFVDRRALPREIEALRARLRCVVLPGINPALTRLLDVMRRFFAGEPAEFDVPLDPFGTPFQHSVWRELREIPPGTTRSYSRIAQQIGRPSAVRAVARANGDNHIAILIPCHRVIGSDGTLTGYGGGLWRKEWLLNHERRVYGTAPKSLFDGGSVQTRNLTAPAQAAYVLSR